MKKINLKHSLSYLFKTGFFHVFGAGTINKIVSLCSSIFIVRILSRNDYGMYGYVLNIVNIFMIFNGLGTLTGLLQYGCMNNEHREKMNAVFRYGISVGFLANVVVSTLLVLYGAFIPQTLDGAGHYIILASFIPMFSYINESISMYLRAENSTKKYGNLCTLNSVLLLALMVVLSFLFGVNGTITARYIASTITIIVGIVICANYRKVFKKNDIVISKDEKKGFLKFSMINCFNNAVSQLLYNIDIFVIGIVIGTTISIANYKVATTIPFGLSFISTAVITYIYPMFVRHREDKQWIKSGYKKLLLALGAINGVIALVCYAAAPFILTFIFGKEYIDSVPCFRILIVGYWISSTFRVPSGNVLDMLLQVKKNFWISVASGVLNIVLDFILVKYMGSVGAAITTTSIYIFTAILSNICLASYLRKCKQ